MGLKAIRTEKGMNIKELAELSGVHLIKIYQIENGTIKPENMSLRNAVRLANALDCDCRDFLKEDEDEEAEAPGKE